MVLLLLFYHPHDNIAKKFTITAYCKHRVRTIVGTEVNLYQYFDFDRPYSVLKIVMNKHIGNLMESPESTVVHYLVFPHASSIMFRNIG